MVNGVAAGVDQADAVILRIGPPGLIERQQELGLRLNRAGASRIEMLITGLRRQQANLAHLHPASVLERGYSIAYTADGTILRDSSQIDVGDVIRMKFAKGWSKANVSEKGE